MVVNGFMKYDLLKKIIVAENKASLYRAFPRDATIFRANARDGVNNLSCCLSPAIML